MHPSILAKRKAQAMDRIVQAVQSLDPAAAEALQPKGIKDPAAAEMMRLEALAALLDQLAANAGVPAPAVTAVTVGEFIVPAPTPPAAEEELPPPVLEEEPVEEPPARRTRSTSKKK